MKVISLTVDTFRNFILFEEIFYRSEIYFLNMICKEPENKIVENRIKNLQHHQSAIRSRCSIALCECHKRKIVKNWMIIVWNKLYLLLLVLFVQLSFEWDRSRAPPTRWRRYRSVLERMVDIMSFFFTLLTLFGSWARFAMVSCG